MATPFFDVKAYGRILQYHYNAYLKEKEKGREAAFAAWRDMKNTDKRLRREAALARSNKEMLARKCPKCRQPILVK